MAQVAGFLSPNLYSGVAPCKTLYRGENELRWLKYYLANQAAY